MPKAGINLTLGGMMLVVVFALSALLLYGGAQLVDSEEPPAAQEEVDGGGGVPGGPANLTITARNSQFDKRSLSASPGAQVTLTFTNADAVPHNVAFYTNNRATEKIFASPLITGPATETYNFTAPSSSGNYFFRCDVHPDTMTGSFIVR